MTGNCKVARQEKPDLSLPSDGVAWRWRGWGSVLGARPRSLRRLLPARSGQRGAWADVGGFLRLTSPSNFNNDKGQVKEPVSSMLVTKGQERGAASWRACEFTLAWRTRCGTPRRRFHVHKRHIQSATRVLTRSQDIPLNMAHVATLCKQRRKVPRNVHGRSS